MIKNINCLTTWCKTELAQYVSRCEWRVGGGGRLARGYQLNPQQPPEGPLVLRLWTCRPLGPMFCYMWTFQPLELHEIRLYHRRLNTARQIQQICVCRTRYFSLTVKYLIYLVTFRREEGRSNYIAMLPVSLFLNVFASQKCYWYNWSVLQTIGLCLTYTTNRSSH